MSYQPVPDIPNPWREFAAIVMRKRRPSMDIAATCPDGERCPAAHGPVSTILVPLILVGLIGDIPLSFVLVAIVHPRDPMAIHVGLAAVSLLTVAWAMAARSALRSLPHVVGEDALWISGGIRFSGVIPKVAIEKTLPIRVSRREWMLEQGLSRGQVMPANGFDPLDLAVKIRETALGQVKIGGRRRHLVPRRWILLYADNPARLAKAVMPALPTENTR